MLHTRSLSLAEFLAVEFPARDASARVIRIPVTRRGITVLHAHQCRLRRSGGKGRHRCHLRRPGGKTSMSSVSFCVCIAVGRNVGVGGFLSELSDNCLHTHA